MTKNGKMGFFLPRHRHDDLKEMLDSNKDSLKLEAMKRIVAVSVAVTDRDNYWCCAGCPVTCRSFTP